MNDRSFNEYVVSVCHLYTRFFRGTEYLWSISQIEYQVRPETQGMSAIEITKFSDLHFSINILQPFSNCGFGLIQFLLHQHWSNKLINCVRAAQQIQLLIRWRHREGSRL